MKLAKIFILTLLFGSSIVFFVFAHCDTINGPVVNDAKQALERANADIVLKWVREQDEEKIKKALNETLEKRKQQPENKDNIDMNFYEEVVELHRAGEGVEYTGIKSGRIEVSSVIETADEAIVKGDANTLTNIFAQNLKNDIQRRFDKVMEKKKDMDKSIAAGREYVAAYVEFMHYIEGISGGQDNKIQGFDKEINHKH